LTDHAPAQNGDITGVFARSYEGPQGTTVFTLSLTEGRTGDCCRRAHFASGQQPGGDHEE
jgi:hypothetical protein